MDTVLNTALAKTKLKSIKNTQGDEKVAVTKSHSQIHEVSQPIIEQ